MSKKKKIVSRDETKKYVILLFAFSVTALIYKAIVGGFGNDGDYLPYTFSYGLGFMHNLFIGTLERLFVGYVDPNDTKVFTIGATVVILFVMSLFFGKVIAKTDEKIRPAYAFVTGTILVMFVMINELSSLNIFSLLFLTTGFMCLEKQSLRRLIPIICFIAMLSDKNFIFGCFVPLFFTMIYVFSKDKNKTDKTVLLSSAGICAVLFMYFEFFESKVKESVDTAVADWLSSSSVSVDKELFEREYVLSSAERIKSLLVSDYKQRFFEITGTLLPIIFLVVILAIFWIFVMKKSKEKECKILCVSGICYVAVMTVISFFVNIELSFISVSSLSALIFPTVYFVHNSKEEYIECAESFFAKNEMMIILLTVFSISSIYFSSKVYNDITATFIEKWWMPF